MKLLPSIALILLGLALGFVLGWALWAGRTVDLFLGVLLVVAGATLGFLVEWFIDEAHRRNRDQIEIKVQATVPESLPQSEATVLAGFLTQRESELREVRSQLANTEKELTECRLVRAGQARELEKLATLKEKLATAERELSELALKPVELQNKLETAYLSLIEYRQKEETYLIELEALRGFKAKIELQPDDLTVIKGIGKVYQQKLRDIGILTFKQLAESDPNRIRRMLDIKNWQATDVAAWVTQAVDWVQRVS
jgi:predicted flap endonuclease-1-like 5' DNA nuclease